MTRIINLSFVFFCFFTFIFQSILIVLSNGFASVLDFSSLVLFLLGTVIAISQEIFKKYITKVKIARVLILLAIIILTSIHITYFFDYLLSGRGTYVIMFIFWYFVGALLSVINIILTLKT